MPLKDRGVRTPSAEHHRALSDAASWMQVVFAGIGVVIALVAAVFGYFAWIQPHSPSSDQAAGPTLPPSATATPAAPSSTSAAPASAATVPLATLKPTAGGANIHAVPAGLVMPCATGQSSDRQRTVEYDLLARYTTFEAGLTVSKAPDADTRVQIKIFADGQEAANRTLTKGPASRLKVPFDGTQTMRIQLTCESPASELTFENPALAHA